MEKPYDNEELEAEMRKIRSAYPWLEENTIRHYALQVLTNRHSNNETV